MVAFNTTERLDAEFARQQAREAVESLYVPEVPVRRSRVDWGSVFAWGLVAGWFAFVFAAMARAGWEIVGRWW